MSRQSGQFIGAIFEHETPSGTVNGSNTEFTLANTPSDSKSVFLFLDQLIQLHTTHYSISGSTITMVSAPQNGQSLHCIYIKK